MSQTATDSCCATGQPTNPLGHHGAVCHVEFTVPDLQKAQQFYAAVFKWQFFPMSERELYFMSPQGGPCGCVIHGSAHTDDKTTFYVKVDDIAAALDHAAKLGAKTVLAKTEIPGGHGFFAKFKAPEGNVMGIYNNV